MNWLFGSGGIGETGGVVSGGGALVHLNPVPTYLPGGVISGGRAISLLSEPQLASLVVQSQVALLGSISLWANIAGK